MIHATLGEAGSWVWGRGRIAGSEDPICRSRVGRELQFRPVEPLLI